MTSILGISAFYHDSAAALAKDGKIVAAAQEERFSRKKHDPSYPFNAIEYVSERIPTVSIVTSSDSYNVYCDSNMYVVHGRYKLLMKQAA